MDRSMYWCTLGMVAGAATVAVARLPVMQPALARPVVARPVVARPVVARPVVARPVVARPVVAQLAAAPTAAAVGGMAPAGAVAAFRAACMARAAAADKAGIITVQGKDGWLFLGSELRHLAVGQFWGPGAARVSRASNPAQADPLPAILDFKAQLSHAGIELLMVPVPAKAVIYPDKLWDGATVPGGLPPRLDPADHEFCGILERNGIRVLDLVPELSSHRNDTEGPVFCMTDTHWSGRACVLAAHQIAKMIAGRPWIAKNALKVGFSQEWRNIEIDGDLRKALGNGAPPRETLPLRFVGTKTSSGLEPIAPNRNSPVILMGDSHNLVFQAGEDMYTRGAGLADQLALELGFPVDLIGVRGSGATPARINLLRRARASTSYLAGKKLVIWCFTTREFTESQGWQKVPVVK